MSGSLRDDRNESEPFLYDDHDDDDIELGERSGVNGQNQFNKFTTSDFAQREKSTELRIGSKWSWKSFVPFMSASGADRKTLRSSVDEVGHDVSSKHASEQSSAFSRIVLRPTGYCLMLLGIVQLVAMIQGLVTTVFQDRLDMLYKIVDENGDVSHWPTDFSADITPVKCHSHNDYWRKEPLFSAIKAGCTGVEADVWLRDHELYVGHSESSLTTERTLTSLYINPLLDILEKQNPITEFQTDLRSPRNGVFDTNPEESLVLMIDFKTDGEALWSVVQEQIEPLRSKNYLTLFNGTTVVPGPITVVATGNAPFHRVIANTTYRDIFFDAPLPEFAQLASESSSAGNSIDAAATRAYDPTEEQAFLARLPKEAGNENNNKGQGYSGSLVPSTPKIYTIYNSYYASTSLKATIGIPFPYMSKDQQTKIQNQIAGAHAQGLHARYWDVPSWPVSWRHYLWRILIRSGIDYLNVDDLVDATKGSWSSVGAVGRAIWGPGNW